MFRQKLTRRVTTIAAAALITLAAVPQADARGWRGFNNRSFKGSNVDLVERLRQSGEFGILLTALETAGLSGTVASADALTLLAPTDAAFADLLEETQLTAEQLLASPDLTDILLYHVVPGKNRAFQLLDRSINPTLLSDASVVVQREGFQVWVNDSRVTRQNIRARNGYIQALDRVLVPTEASEVNSIVDVLELDGRFGTLLSALETAGLTGALEDTSAELTLFAPTDEAFTDLLAQLDLTAEQLLASPNLADILMYHVAAGDKRALPLLQSGGTDTLLEGESVSVTFRRAAVLVNDAKVINADVKAPNGIVHVIDAVLLP